MVNMGAESILVLGQFEHLSSSESVDLQGYDAQVRFVSERAEFTASVENNGSFPFRYPKDFTRFIHGWIRVRAYIPNSNHRIKSLKFLIPTKYLHLILV